MGQFVGQERHEVVTRLIHEFEATATKGVSAVCLTSPLGWGKTRLIQEFYGQLAEQQPVPSYWPPRIESPEDSSMGSMLASRKMVYPDKVTVPDGAKMHWFWWGISCQMRPSGEYSQALVEHATQLTAHGAEPVRALSEIAGRLFDISSSTYGLLGIPGMMISPSLGVAMAVTGAARTCWENRDLLDRRSERPGNHHGERELDVSGAGRGVQIRQIAKSIARVSRKVPFVLVVDDAHFADDTLVDVLDLLFEEEKARILIVATTWGNELDDESPRPFAKWWNEIRNSQTENLLRIDLNPLAEGEIGELINSELPGISAETFQALHNHVGSNPLVLRAIARLPKINRRFQSGYLTPGDIGGLPTQIDAIYQEWWHGLPQAVQHALALGSQMGREYVPEVVLDVAQARNTDEISPDLVRDLLHHSWVRELAPDLHAFIEPTLWEVARRGADDILDFDDRAAVCRALVSSARDAHGQRFGPRASAALWHQHVELARSGQVEPDDLASESAWKIATQSSERYLFSDAIRFAELAILWSSAPSDSHDGLRRRSNLAYWRGESGRTLDAIEEFRTLLQDKIRTLGSEDRDTLTTRNDLAYCLSMAGFLNEAIDEYSALLDDQTRLFGSEDEETLRTRNNLAFCHGLSGSVDKAIYEFKALLNDYLHLRGSEYEYTLATRQSLAFWLREAGQIHKATRQYEILLEDQVRILGPHHFQTFVTRQCIACLLGESGQPSAAITRLEILHKEFVQHFDADHPAALICRNTLALWLAEVGRTDEAIVQNRKLLEDKVRVLGARNPDTLLTKNNLAYCLAESGELDEAFAMFDTVLRDQIGSLDPDHPDILNTRRNFAHWSGESGAIGDAVEQLQDLFVDDVRILGPNHPDTLRTRSVLGRWLGESGAIGGAVEQLDGVLSVQIHVLGPNHPDTLQTRSNLARWLGESGAIVDAIQQLDEVLADQIRVLELDHRDTLRTRKFLSDGRANWACE